MKTAPSLTFGTFCSGIGAPEQAWGALGWTAKWCSEIAAFPSAVLAHHFPSIPNLGDMEKLNGDDLERVDVICAGTPCQSFSVAGLRKGMADPRGNLALVFLRLIDRRRPPWLVWENVPGVLSSGGGRDFGAFLGGLGQLGYGWAYRVLDPQYVRVESHPYAVPQVRRRVFVVGYLGGWQRAAAVLFERESLSGHPAPRREAGQGVAGTIAARTSGGGGFGTDFDCRGGLIAVPHADVSPALKARDGKGPSSDGDGDGDGDGAVLVPMVARTLKADGSDASEDGGERCTPFVPVGFNWYASAAQSMPVDRVATGLRATNQPAVMLGQYSGVRRLTPRECERLQGMPDDFTLVPYRKGMAADAPRYKAIGNSIALPPLSWIGQRIEIAAAMAEQWGSLPTDCEV